MNGMVQGLMQMLINKNPQIANNPNAVEMLKKAVRIDANDYASHANMALAYVRLSKDELALIEFRNAFQIKEVNGKFNIIRYRHYVPIEIHSIKFLSNNKVDWEYIGSTHEDGMQYFETYDEAKDYIISQNMYQ